MGHVLPSRTALLVQKGVEELNTWLSRPGYEPVRVFLKRFPHL
jgi:hypothetical protein